MTWVQLDDRWDLNEKLERASELPGVGDSAWSVWVRAVTHCNRQLTDGRVHGATLRSRTKNKKAQCVIDALVKVGALRVVGDDEYELHDYLKHNPSRATVEARREKKREAASRGGLASGAARQKSVKPEHTSNENEAACFASVNQWQTEAKHAGVKSFSISSPSPSGSEEPDIHDHPEPVGSAHMLPMVMSVWTAYIDGRKRNGSRGAEPVLNDKRKRLIRARIKDHGVETVTAAARGIWLHPWNREKGETSIDLAMRDATHIERFAPLGGISHSQPNLFDTQLRDELPARYRNQPAKPEQQPATLESLREAAAAMRAQGLDPHPAMLATIRKLESESAA